LDVANWVNPSTVPATTIESGILSGGGVSRVSGDPRSAGVALRGSGVGNRSRRIFCSGFPRYAPPNLATLLQCPAMFDLYFVYILQSISRRALYIGFTKCLISRVIEHRARHRPNSFAAKYRTWRLVYYEEFGDSAAAFARERQLKGWSRAKKEWLITRLNPRWRDLVSEWEEKYGVEFRLDGQMVAKPGRGGWATDPTKLVPGSPAALAMAAAAQKSVPSAVTEGPGAGKSNPKTKDPSTPVSRADETAREPSSAQDA